MKMRKSIYEIAIAMFAMIAIGSALFGQANAGIAINRASVIRMLFGDQVDSAAGFKCPDAFGYYPHEICWKFYQCSNGQAYVMDCAPGTMWNQTLLTCDHLNPAVCDRPASPGTTNAPEPTTPEAEEPTTAEQEETTTAEPMEPITSEPEETTTAEPEDDTTVEPDQGFKCPSQSGYYPHEICWKFYQCSNGDAYEMDCAPGTMWNQTLLTCDHLNPEVCDRPASPGTSEPTTPEAEETTTAEPEEPTTAEPEEPTTAEPEEPTTTEPEEPTTAEPEETTTAEPEDDTTVAPDQGFKCPSPSGYYPHEICWKFYQCSNGQAYAMDCAPGTMWNQTLLTCDHLNPSVCDRPASPPTTMATTQY